MLCLEPIIVYSFYPNGLFQSPWKQLRSSSSIHRRITFSSITTFKSIISVQSLICLPIFSLNAFHSNLFMCFNNHVQLILPQDKEKTIVKSTICTLNLSDQTNISVIGFIFWPDGWPDFGNVCCNFHP